MSEKQCPLCGKPLSEHAEICSECKESAQNRGVLNILSEAEDDKIEESALKNEKISGDTDIREDVGEKEPISAPVKKKGNKKLIIFFFAGLLACIGVGIAYHMMGEKQRKEKQAELNFWYECIEENTPLAYSKYLIVYPEGDFRQEAQQKIKEIRETEYQEWEKLKKSSNVNDYYSFLAQYPETPFKSDIRHILDSLSWIVAEKNNTKESYLDYINNTQLGNINGHYVTVATERYDYLRQIVKLEGMQLDTVQNVLSEFFKTLSNQKFKELDTLFSPVVANYYLEKEIQPSAIIKSIQKDLKKDKIKNITYDPDFKTISALKDPAHITFVDITVSHKITYTARKKKAVSKKENLTIELDPDMKIRSLYLQNKK